MKPQTAFIGLGAMGFPMACRLLDAGYPVKTAVHRNLEKASQLKEKGAVIASDFSEAVKGAKLIFSIVPADEAMKALYLNEQVMAAIDPEAIVIEMTSASMSAMQEIGQALQKRNIRVLDSPVSGGISGAREGTLTFIVGGDAAVLDEVRPALECMASRIIHVGPLGAGKGMKAANQMLVGIHMAAAAQALALAESVGIDPDTFFQVISTSSGASKVLENKFQLMKNHRFDQGFQLQLLVKDMNIALAQGEGLDLSMLEQASALFAQVPAELAEKDFAVISELFRKA
ncbi:NAD(P)-dependent oxidoreductase [Anoxynatronum buryatiense]|uniref:3-hydroxyisobutyrate dehydrogenase n=1 Tax=Anoxynatronum buryatiense TaxID=489973 RepID=A0AA45X041_9CLOT|nr:NAD(P)-dependent oxidoreductase [Anoxynatronum buryatiense]SMP70445.1 3-hydroxyisobutyrate dehydrogenase [Anoxynatronum buryatiense]